MITNSAIVTSTTADPNAANGVASAAVQIASGVDLMVTKTASSTTFTPGKRLTFTIVVGNTGSDDVVGAQVRDLVPAALNGFDWTCSAVLGQCADLAGVGSIVQTVDIRAGGRVTYRLSGLVTQRSVTTIANRVTVSAPPDVVDTDPTNNVAAARVRLGIVPTRLRVTITPGFTIVASGEPTRFVVRTTNAGTSVAKSVVTCITIPMGASVAKASGGIVAKGHYCWRAASLPPGKTVQYVISILADRRQAQHLALVASAGARNAPSTHARARVNVLAEVKKMTGGYTG
jgi:conserved repeat domain